MLVHARVLNNAGHARSPDRDRPPRDNRSCTPLATTLVDWTYGTGPCESSKGTADRPIVAVAIAEPATAFANRCMSVVVIVLVGRRGTLRAFRQKGGLGADIGDQVRGIALGEFQVRHSCAGKLRRKRKGDRVLFGQYLVGGPDEPRQPFVAPALANTAQIRPHAITDADRMAGSAYFFEHGLTRLKLIDRIPGIARRIELRLADLSAPLRIHGANIHDKAVDV